MATYRLKIVGVHYAVNPDSFAHAEETELMHQRTAERLRELSEQRPAVALVPEPTNPVDPRAVMARVMGKRIGYVDKTQLDIVHSLLQSNGGRPLIARIDEVEARKHGWLFVTFETRGEVPVEPLPKAEDAWREWESDLPVIVLDEAHFAREEAEVMLDEVLSKHPIMLVPSGFAPQSTQIDIDLIETYVRLWLRSALHDLSNEARLTREHYIMRLKEMASQNATPPTEPLPRIRVLVSELEKQRTAICGQKRSTLRVDKWWKELMQSGEMDRLWKTWTARNTEGMEQMVTELDTILRALPFDLYAYIDDRKLFFSRLHYAGVPRTKYWQIVSLMLLRERAMHTMRVDAATRMMLDLVNGEGGDETYHPWKNESFSQVEGRGSETERHLGQEGCRPISGPHPEEGGCNQPLHPGDQWGYETYPHPEQEETKFLVTIPKELQTPEAKKIIAKLQKKGYLDADLQPVGLSGAKKGVLAWELCDFLGIKHCWKTMGTLWKCNGETIRKARDKGIMRPEIIDFTKIIKALLY